MPAVVVDRNDWLDACVAMRGDGGAASIEVFGAAAKELLGLGVVRVTGGMAWVVDGLRQR